MKIYEVCKWALEKAKRPLTAEEMLEIIEDNHWYEFQTNNPLPIIKKQLNRRTLDYKGDDRKDVWFVKEGDKYNIFIPKVDMSKKKNAKEEAKNIIGNLPLKKLEEAGIEIVWKSEHDMMRFVAACADPRYL